jgi:hypothetical protein
LGSLRVDRLPSDEHGKDGGLASAGGEFQCEPHQLCVGVSFGRREMVKQALAVLGLGCDSVSQFAVSTAATRQKKGRTPLKLDGASAEEDGLSPA